jgi:AcrR family transcriptional regulator
MPFTERSEVTRSAILLAARRCFASAGYAGTTIRGVAAQAGIDPSMVMRYYGSKAGLFSAAIDVDLGLPDIHAEPPGRIGAVLARHFVERWEGEAADGVLVLLLRSAVTSPEAAERMREVFAKQVTPVVVAVAGDGPETAERTMLVATQVLGVALCRHVLRLPPVAMMDSSRLVELMAPVLQHYLTGPLGSPVTSADAAPVPSVISPPG